MPRTRPIPAAIEVWEKCPFCRGTGEMKEERTAIAASSLKYHIKNHANTIDMETRKVIGADCDCPRETTVIKRRCVGCAPITKHMVLRTISLPKKNENVIVKDRDVMAEVFGKNIPIDPVGTVVNVLHPEDPNNTYELEHGWAVMVAWDPAPLTKAGTIRSGIEYWAFDPDELQIQT